MTVYDIPHHPLLTSAEQRPCAAGTARRPDRGTAKFGGSIGRVGALAAALGIGLMIATSPGVASADPIGSNSQSSDSSPSSKPSLRGESSTSRAASTKASTSASREDAGGATDTPGSEGVGDEVTTDNDVADDDSSAQSTEEESPDDVAGDEVAPEPEPEAEESETPYTGESGIEPPAESHSDDSDLAGTTATSATSPRVTSQKLSRVTDSLERSTTVSQPASPSTEQTGQADTVRTATIGLTDAADGATHQIRVNPVVGVATFFNSIVANLLSPFLKPAPNTADPFTPVVWAVLGWVRRNVFNEAPTITYDAGKNLQTGQTITGNIGAVDPEGDELTYKVTPPSTGTFVLDQATGNFTFTPDDIDYLDEQVFPLKVTVSDGRTNLLSLLGVRHSDTDTLGFAVKPPTVDLTVLDMPDGVTKPVNPRYAEDGKSIFFAGTPTAGGRREVYQISIDGTGAKCLTCGLVAPPTAGTNPAVPINLGKPVPFYDGTGRIVVLLDNPEPRYAVFEPGGHRGIGSPAQIVAVNTPDGGGASFPGLPAGGILDRQREMRPSPDGTHVLFTRIVIGQTGNFQALPIVGALTWKGDHYDVTNARVVWPTGESKQWTPDGKGVIIQGGQFDAGNVDDIMVDLSGQTGSELYPGSPFRGIRITGNLDYDEDIDLSPNMRWMAVGSTRGFEALTPMTRITRQNFLPVYIGAAVYFDYADEQVRNVSNQNWLVAIEDDLKRENGIPLFVQDDPSTPGVDEGDGWANRSMPSWNADGTAVTFWESGNNDEHGIPPSESRIVIANLKYTTSVGPVGDKATVFNPSAFPALDTYVARPTPLPPTGTYSGVGGGTALVSEVVDGTTFQTTRTVLYTNYINEDGLVLNGTESATYGPSQTRVTYLADVDVTDETGAARGSYDADAVFTLLPTQSVTGHITSTLDGDTQSIPNPDKAEDAKTGA